jgi:hypothetical protein
MVFTQLQIITKLSSNKLYENLKIKQEILNTPDFVTHINNKYKELENKKIIYEKKIKEYENNIKLYNIIIKQLDFEHNINIITKLQKARTDFETLLLENIHKNLKFYQTKLILINKKLKYSANEHLIQLRRTIKDKLDNIKIKCSNFYNYKKIEFIVPNEKLVDLKTINDYTTQKNIILTPEKKNFINETELYFINEILYICDTDIYNTLLNYFII